MGHITNPEREYRWLQERLDQTLTGAPDSPVLMKILRLLFSPEDAQFARRIPNRLTSLDALSQKLAVPADELDARLADMARRGLVVDLEHQGQRYFSLAPIVIGFYEFTFMRTRDDIPIAELARLFDEYMLKDDRFCRSLFAGRTQLGRSLVREEALPDADHTEILDWERASHIVQSASSVGVSLCTCRHKARHLGKACDRLTRNCLSLNYAADILIRNSLAERLTTDEAMRVLEESQEAGLAQIGDNVQRKVAYICNCCACCCGFFQAIRLLGHRNAVVTSNWIVEVDVATCRRCGECVKACPVGALAIHPDGAGKKSGTAGPEATLMLDASLCLGCGICCTACPTGALAMKPRASRTYTPETIFDRVVSMAIERGKLGDVLFDDPTRLTHRALGRLVGVLEKSRPFKAAMAIESFRSTFLTAIVKGSKRKSGRLAEIFE